MVCEVLYCGIYEVCHQSVLMWIIAMMFVKVYYYSYDVCEI